MIRALPPFQYRPPRSRWRTVFVLCCCALSTASCDPRDQSPDWKENKSEHTSAAQAEPTSSGSPSNARKQPSPADSPTPPSNQGNAGRSAATGRSGPASLRFVHYNVENWLMMDRRSGNRTVNNAPKPDPAKRAVIRLLAASNPDAVGLCEIGTAADLAEIQSLLRDQGVNLPHSHFTGGSDEVRHLGFLSRFPISKVGRPAEVRFRLRGQSFEINRGILDVTVTSASKSWRFLGVHLKSKREVDDADQQEIRVHEARLLRRHVDSILSRDPHARLVVYGDFNDTRPSAAFKAVTGSYREDGYLTPVPFQDSQGDFWTHHWRPHDIYSRIDFVLVSRSLRSEVDFRASRLIDGPGWDEASDHRALLAIFR